MDGVIRCFLVTGKVQGVYFRQSTRIEARRMGLRGSARNLPDGSVEVWAQGDVAALEVLHQWLKRGPAHARVDAVREVSYTPGEVPEFSADFAVL